MAPQKRTAGLAGPADVVDTPSNEMAYTPDGEANQFAVTVIARRFHLSPIRARLVAGLAMGGPA